MDFKLVFMVSIVALVGVIAQPQDIDFWICRKSKNPKLCNCLFNGKGKEVCMAEPPEETLTDCKENEPCIVTIKSSHGKYVSAEQNGNANAKKSQPETWTVTFVNKNKINFKSGFNKYLVAEPNGNVFANRDVANAWEEFTIIDKGDKLFFLKSHHGKYMVAEPNGNLYANRINPSSWEQFRIERV